MQGPMQRRAKRAARAPTTAPCRRRGIFPSYRRQGQRPARSRLGSATALGLGVVLAHSVSASASKAPDFQLWLDGVRSEALERGISPQTVELALSELEPEPRVLEKDRSQPRRPQEFCDYMKRRLTTTRIKRARALLETHGSLLAELNAKYGVPPRYLVSLWGLESNFGDYSGDYSVIRSLATLAYDPRRSESFRKQLLSALQILDEGHLRPDQMEGSWAGAMGQVQFMPTTFLAYAVDYDGDGRKDIWNSVPDALASAANYLDQAGWRKGQMWGRRVQLPGGLALEGRTSPAHSLSEWRKRGVRRYDGGELPHANMRASVVRPTAQSTPAFLVYPNYHAILAWNHSTFFGISVGTLADRLEMRTSSPVCSR